MTATVNETIEDTIELIKICVFLFLQEIETTKPRKLTDNVDWISLKC